MLMSKDTAIGRGRTAGVFSWGKGKALKLFYEWYPAEKVFQEAEICQAVHETGIPSPYCYGIIDVENRRGILYENIAGTTLLKDIKAKPWALLYFARQMARLHIQIHGCSLIHLSTQAESYSLAIKESTVFTTCMRHKILFQLNSLPRMQNVCHGDFHPDNILMSGKRAVVIDWSNAYSGHPLSDVARTYLLIKTPFVVQGTGRLLKWLVKPLKELLWRAYWKEYRSLSNLHASDLEPWILAAAAARLSEDIPGEKKWLLSLINKRGKISGKISGHNENY